MPDPGKLFIFPLSFIWPPPTDGVAWLLFSYTDELPILFTSKLFGLADLTLFFWIKPEKYENQKNLLTLSLWWLSFLAIVIGRIWSLRGATRQQIASLLNWFGTSWSLWHFCLSTVTKWCTALSLWCFVWAMKIWGVSYYVVDCFYRSSLECLVSFAISIFNAKLMLRMWWIWSWTHTYTHAKWTYLILGTKCVTDIYVSFDWGIFYYSCSTFCWALTWI